jgi:hypothetical protein
MTLMTIASKQRFKIEELLKVETIVASGTKLNLNLYAIDRQVDEYRQGDNGLF